MAYRHIATFCVMFDCGTRLGYMTKKIKKITSALGIEEDSKHNQLEFEISITERANRLEYNLAELRKELSMLTFVVSESKR